MLLLPPISLQSLRNELSDVHQQVVDSREPKKKVWDSKRCYQNHHKHEIVIQLTIISSNTASISTITRLTTISSHPLSITTTQYWVVMVFCVLGCYNICSTMKYICRIQKFDSITLSSHNAFGLQVIDFSMIWAYFFKTTAIYYSQFCSCFIITHVSMCWNSSLFVKIFFVWTCIIFFMHMLLKHLCIVWIVLQIDFLSLWLSLPWCNRYWWRWRIISCVWTCNCVILLISHLAWGVNKYIDCYYVTSTKKPFSNTVKFSRIR